MRGTDMPVAARPGPSQSGPGRVATLIAALAMLAVLPACQTGVFGRSVGITSGSAGRGENRRAAKALARQDYAKAIVAGERAVAAAPHDAGYRLTLATAYLRAGRFTSARQAFQDVTTLAPGLERAQIGLALTAILTGDDATARSAIAGMSSTAAADRGLALALLGDNAEALSVLDEAARSPLATARTRQNLALAHALAGDWTKARVIAAQDLNGAVLAQRLGQWVVLAAEPRPAARVASLIGVTPASVDPGLPATLALAPPPAADPASQDQAVVLTAPVDEPVLSPVGATTVDRPVATPSSVAVIDSGWVVQLGAYARAGQLARGWTYATARLGEIPGLAPAVGRVEQGGRVLHRLVIAGFPDRAAATALCDHYRAGGGECFVRTGGKDLVTLATLAGGGPA